jgi:5'-3' exonuclease
LKIGATPLFVFDGTHVTEKSKTQEKRRADKQKMINDAEDMKLKILEIDELERTPGMITELRKKMQNLGYLGYEDKEIIKGILSAVGIPVMIAEGEGEQLCAMLCIEGKVDAVYSRDTDLTAFGCPLTINEPSGYVYNEKTHQVEESLKCTVFKPVLSALDMEYKTFLDLCIMAGCDFNDNIPHLGVGKAYPVLKKCKNIENLPAKYHTRAKCGNKSHATCQRIVEEYPDQTVCLNHVRCREIFKHMPSENICQDNIILNINTQLEDARDRLEMYGAEDWLTDIVPLYKNIVKPSDVVIPKYPSLSRSTIKLNIGNHGNSSTPVLNIVPTAGSRVKVQKASPKQISSKQVNNLSKSQHVRLQKRLQKKQNSLPKLDISNKNISSPVVLNIVSQ